MSNPMDKKNIQVFLIFILTLPTKFQDPISNGSWPSASVTHRRRDGRKDRRTDRPKPIRLPNFFEVGGIMIRLVFINKSVDENNVKLLSV